MDIKKTEPIRWGKTKKVVKSRRFLFSTFINSKRQWSFLGGRKSPVYKRGNQNFLFDESGMMGKFMDTDTLLRPSILRLPKRIIGEWH